MMQRENNSFITLGVLILDRKKRDVHSYSTFMISTRL